MPAKDSALPKGVTLRKDGRYMWRCKYEGKQYNGYEEDRQRSREGPPK